MGPDEHMSKLVEGSHQCLQDEKQAREAGVCLLTSFFFRWTGKKKA